MRLQAGCTQSPEHRVQSARGCARLVELRLGEEERAALALDVQPVRPLLGAAEGQPEHRELVGGVAEERVQPSLPRGREVLLEDPPG